MYLFYDGIIFFFPLKSEVDNNALGAGGLNLPIGLYICWVCLPFSVYYSGLAQAVASTQSLYVLFRPILFCTSLTFMAHTVEQFVL